MISLKEILEDLILEDKLPAIQAKFVGDGPKKFSQELFDKLVSLDPTTNHNYSEWILNKYNKIQDKSEFDKYGDKIFKSLELFNRIKNKFPFKDINQYQTILDLVTAAEQVQNELDATELEKGKSKKDKYSEYKIIENNDWTVYEIPQGRDDLEKMSCELGSGTSWCTAYDADDGETNALGEYIQNGPIYIFISKHDPSEKYQLHFESEQFMDRNDSHIIDWYGDDGEPEFEEPSEELLQLLLTVKNQLNPRLVSFIENNLDLYYEVENLWDYWSLVKNSKGQYKIKKRGKPTLNWDIDRGVFTDYNLNQLTDNQIMILQVLHAKNKQGKGGSKIHPLYRILFDIDLPKDRPYTIKQDVNLRNPNITKLPDNLTVKGDLVLRKSNLKELPNNLTVDGFLDLRGTNLEPKSDTKAKRVFK